ncbi:unnamed protein product [Protopolystoma xenopodis]|uniref:Uncharacterized protein n=1 Tax=Protopolystoma xenopodis TaxID=117903 RepID=A0A3S5FHD9_9PLAT|nr:unnamed protein product [Protopolystoma xenopodis]
MAENADLVEFYGQLARSLNPSNLAGYIDAYINRTDLGLIRPLISTGTSDTHSAPIATAGKEPSEVGTPAPLSVIQTDVCLVTGDRATDLSRALADMNGRMDPKITQFILVRFIEFRSGLTSFSQLGRILIEA